MRLNILQCFMGQSEVIHSINENFPYLFLEEKNGTTKLARLGVFIATQTIEEKLPDNEKKTRHGEKAKPAEQTEKEDAQERVSEKPNEDIGHLITGGNTGRSEVKDK